MSLQKLFRRIVRMLFITGISITNMVAQSDPPRPVMTDTMHFHTYQKLMNAYFENNPTAKGRKQWKRKEWFLAPRLYPSGKLENLTLKTWRAYDRYLKTQPSQRATHGSWTFLGPLSHPVGLGRVNAIAFHPTNANTMYIGSANGGVWKTTNGGANWTNISPDIPLLAVADIQLSPTNPNVIYILTGDGDPVPGETSIHAQTEVSSIGILRSADGGATWHPTNFSFGVPSLLVPTQLRIHPTNPNIQYVANELGIHRTTDHWANWTLEVGTIVYDIEFKPDDPNIMYAASDNQILRSVDAGDNWSVVSDPDLNLFTGARIELAVAPNNTNIVYALSGDWNGFLDFYKSSNQGVNNSWTLQTTSAFSMGGFTNYCVALAVDPADWTDVFGGMQWICKSLNEGVTWSSIVDDFVHADIHDVAYTNDALWVCCDGGLYKSTDEGASWTNLTTGLAITEVYRVAGTAMNAELYFLGAQDNGTMRRNGATTSFGEAYGGDGMVPMIDHSNDNIIYASSQNGVFGKSTTGGGNGSFNYLPVPGGAGAWITPAVMDPIDPEILFVGKTTVQRASNGGDNLGDWEDIGSPFSEPINCLAQGTSNTNRLYASSGSLLYRTDNAKIVSGNATWTNIGGDVPNLAISGIAVDPENSLRVFVTLSGYIEGTKVYRSENGGSTWTNISGSLPNVPANCIAFHGNGSGLDEIYIGTDIGVFYRNNALGDWIFYSNFMPAVNVSDLYINTGNNTIVAATYGRGLWRSSVYTGCSANLLLSNSGIPIGGVRFYSSSNSISSNVAYKKEAGTSIFYQTGNYINLTTDFNAGAIGFFEAKTGPCPDIYYEPIISPYNPSGKFTGELIPTEHEEIVKEQKE